MTTPRFNRHTRLTVVLALLATMLLGIIPISSAQTQFSLTESYTWESYNLTVRYPADWTVLPKETSISVRPDGFDVTDGFGPEMVLFVAETTGTSAPDLTNAIRALAADIDGVSVSPETGVLAGHTTMTAAVEWAEPAASGQIMLIIINAQTVIGMAYVVRDTDNALFSPVLAGMALSITPNQPAISRATSESSQTVTSVRLPQTYTWDLPGLTFHLPADWETELIVEEGLDQLRFTPTDSDDYEIGSLLFEQSLGLTVDELVTMVSLELEVFDGPVDTVVAGYDAVIFDAIDEGGNPPNLARTAIIDIDELDMYVVIIFAAEERVWDDFRPTVSAMLSSLEATPNPRATQIDPTPAKMNLLANTIVQPDQLASPPVQADEEGADERFVWEEFNVSFDLPDGWVSEAGNGQDYDLALVSPAAINTGVGAFITLRGIPMLGTTDDFAASLQSLSDQTGSPVLNPYSIGDVEGAVGINFNDEQDNTFHFLILPYSDRGDAIYIQTTAPTNDDVAVMTILNTIEIEPLEVNWSVIDEAWQTSLAENNMLTVGDPAAPVRMREFLSFTCGHCIRYSRSMERLMALEVAEGNVLLDIVPIPGDEFATTAALATYCATEQGMGYTAHEILLQASVNAGYQSAYSRDGINLVLEDTGLDMDELNTCLDEERYSDLLTQNGIGFADLGLTGTPTVAFGIDGQPVEPVFLPDGQIWSGAIPLQWLREIVSRYIDEGIVPADFFDR